MIVLCLCDSFLRSYQTDGCIDHASRSYRDGGAKMMFAGVDPAHRREFLPGRAIVLSLFHALNMALVLL